MLAGGYVEILRTPGTARPLAWALVARVPDSIAALAIVMLVRSATGSYSTAGLAAAGYGIGTAAGAPLAGRALDRLGQRPVLFALAPAFATALAGLVAATGRLGLEWSVGLAVAAGLTRPPLEAALRALWPRLVPGHRLDHAYALDSTLQELVWIAGPLLLAALVALGSPALALLACAGLSVAGTALYSTSPRVPAGGHGADGAEAPLRSARLRLLLSAAGLYGAAVGVLMVALTAFAAAHGGSAATGVLVAIWGLGSLAGGLAYGSRRWRSPVERRALVALAAFAAALALLAAAPDLPVLALLMVPLGLPLSPWLGALGASVERAVPRGATAEAFTWTFAVITLAIAAGNALAGVVVEAAGTGAAFLAAAGAAFAGVALAGARRSTLGLGRPAQADSGRP